MKTYDAETQRPLGFADLDEGEAAIVALYRHWQDQAPTPAIAEHRIAVILKRDPLHGGLDALFALFRDVGPDPEPCRAASGVLSPAECALLDLLAPPRDAAVARSDTARPCRAALGAAGVVSRPLAAIPASGADQIEAAICRSYLAIVPLPR